MARSSQICVAICSSFAPGPRSHAYNACRARARARVSTLVRDIEPVEEIRHFERGHRRFVALVSHRAARASLGLRIIVGVEDAEADRHVELGAGLRKPTRAFACHVLEVWGIAADDRAQRDDALIPVAGEQAAN